MTKKITWELIMSSLTTGETGERLAGKYSAAANHEIQVNSIAVATELRDILCAADTLVGVLIPNDTATPFFEAIEGLASKLEDGEFNVGTTEQDTMLAIRESKNLDDASARQLAFVIHRAIQKAYEKTDGEDRLKISGSKSNFPVMVCKKE